jgi:hypothetical protein
MAFVAICALLVLPTPTVTGASSSKKVEARSLLTRTEDAVDDDAKGRIDFRVKKGEYKLKIKAQRLTGIAAVDFVLLDDEGDELEVIRSDVAVEVDDDGDGTAKVSLRSKDGDTFEGAGTEIDGDLAGQPVGVRTAGADDIDLLWGRIPILEKSGPKKIKTGYHAFGDVEKAKARIKWRRKDGRIRVKIKLPFAGLAEGDSVGFLLSDEPFEDDDDDDGFLLDFGTVNDEGRVKLKHRTDKGDPFPEEILENPGALSGAYVRAFHDANDNGELDEGEATIDGRLPTFSF